MQAFMLSNQSLSPLISPLAYSFLPQGGPLPSYPSPPLLSATPPPPPLPSGNAPTPGQAYLVTDHMGMPLLCLLSQGGQIITAMRLPIGEVDAPPYRLRPDGAINRSDGGNHVTITPEMTPTAIGAWGRGRSVDRTPAAASLLLFTTPAVAAAAITATHLRAPAAALPGPPPRSGVLLVELLLLLPDGRLQLRQGLHVICDIRMPWDTPPPPPPHAIIVRQSGGAAAGGAVCAERDLSLPLPRASSSSSGSSMQVVYNCRGCRQEVWNGSEECQHAWVRVGSVEWECGISACMRSHLLNHGQNPTTINRPNHLLNHLQPPLTTHAALLSGRLRR